MLRSRVSEYANYVLHIALNVNTRWRILPMVLLCRSSNVQNVILTILCSTTPENASLVLRIVAPVPSQSSVLLARCLLVSSTALLVMLDMRIVTSRVSAWNVLKTAARVSVFSRTVLNSAALLARLDTVSRLRPMEDSNACLTALVGCRRTRRLPTDDRYTLILTLITSINLYSSLSGLNLNVFFTQLIS